MSTNVYANDNEICSKASSGKSGPAAPDVCMSPPGPSAGPIPIPYANIGKASDLKAGSSTVFIKKKEVALKNVSFFSTSSGNEGATRAFKKGVSTSVIKGKCFFTDWSANVKFEGLNVCRHLDTMTHNHG
jgi:hypothetical protein